MDADDMDDNSLKQNAEEEFERPRVSPHANTTSGSAPSRASSPELARGLVAQDTALSDRSSCSDLLPTATTNMGSLSAKRLRSGPLSDFDDSSLLSSNMSPPSPLVSSHSPRPHAAAVTGSSTASNAHTLVDIASTNTRVSDLPDKLPCDAPPKQRRALVDLDLLLHGFESLNPGVKLNDMVINTLIQRLASAQVGVLNTFQICCQRTDSLRVRLQETCVQQTNSHDCGVYALKFADHIGTRAPLPQSLPRGGLADRCALGRALLSSWNAVLRPDEWGGTSDDVSATSTPGDRAGRLLDFMTSMSHYRHLMSRPQRGHATECSAVELKRLVHKETCWHQLQVLSDFIDEHHATHKATLQHACEMANELRRGIDYKLQFTRQMLQGIDIFLNAYSNAKGSLGPHPWGSENQFARLIDATKNTATVAKECWDGKRQDDGFLAQRAAVQTAFGACAMHIVLLHKAVQKFRALAKAQPGGF
ncbi:ulp1 protease family protein [Colletotrichum truncatum]|uniref:Ulp1 protease family protein n=1 Tax=Colletotrichum truncatum TaxID=5467 RepID=A0ACC3YBR7_COLTU